MERKEALDIIEKRVRCSNLFDDNYCNHVCKECKYVLTPEESVRLTKALEIVWKMAKRSLDSAGKNEEEANKKCSYLLPCGLCEELTKVYGLPHVCKTHKEREVKNNARER